jgi:hypothetical protein
MSDIALDLSDFNEDEQRQILSRLEEEKAKILRHREFVKQQHIKHLNNVALLRIAADYLDWLYIYQLGSQLSTFVNQFCYDSMSAKVVFNQVEKLYSEMNTMMLPGDALLADVDYAKPPYGLTESTLESSSKQNEKELREAKRLLWTLNLCNEELFDADFIVDCRKLLNS